MTDGGLEEWCIAESGKTLLKRFGNVDSGHLGLFKLIAVREEYVPEVLREPNACPEPEGTDELMEELRLLSEIDFLAIQQYGLP